MGKAAKSGQELFDKITISVGQCRYPRNSRRNECNARLQPLLVANDAKVSLDTLV